MTEGHQVSVRSLEIRFLIYGLICHGKGGKLAGATILLQ